MKNLIVLTALILSTGCANMTSGQKTAAVVIGGIIVASILGNSGSEPPNVEADKPCPIAIPGDPPGFTTICP